MEKDTHTENLKVLRIFKSLLPSSEQTPTPIQAEEPPASSKELSPVEGTSMPPVCWPGRSLRGPGGPPEQALFEAREIMPPITPQQEGQLLSIPRRAQVNVMNVPATPDLLCHLRGRRVTCSPLVPPIPALIADIIPRETPAHRAPGRFAASACGKDTQRESPRNSAHRPSPSFSKLSVAWSVSLLTRQRIA